MAYPRLETDRLSLVVPTPDHLPAYTAYCASDRSQFVGGPYDAVQAFEKFCAISGHWTMRNFGRYVLVHRETGQFIGHVGALQVDATMPPEMTWTLWSDAFEGKGYAFEAATAYLAQARGALKHDRLLIRILENNARSLKLAERLGAEHDKTAAAPEWMQGALTFGVRLDRDG